MTKFYIAPLQGYYSGALPTVEKDSFEASIERFRVDSGMQAQRQREPVPEGGANHSDDCPTFLPKVHRHRHELLSYWLLLIFPIKAKTPIITHS